MSVAAWAQVVVTVLGLVMGSAVTAIAHRVPRGLSWVRGRSACPSCGHVLGPLDLVPVLSWLARQGRCAYCRARVGPRYPFTELLCGAWALLSWRHGLAMGMPFGAWPFVALWGFLLVALLWIDLDVQLLPDVLTLPGTLLALGAAVAWGVLDGAPAAHLRGAMFGMITGAGLLWLVAEGYFRLRKVEGMGFGDVKLAAMFGALLGPAGTLFAIFLAAFAGSIVGLTLMARGRGGMKTALPFGVFLAPAAMIAWLWGAPIIAAYVRLLHRP